MHFTYAPLCNDQLCQGDVIARTPAVSEILKDIHPHYYRKDDYKHLIVLTQSCDLYCRGGAPCSSRYVTLAAIRPMSVVLERYVAKQMNSKVEQALRVCSDKRKAAVADFVARLLNNNEDSYFYLHRQPDAGLHEDCCAFLHLSIAVKSELHYSALLGSKILQLEESFQHKLGFLVGKLYSRVGTRDWCPDVLSESAFQARVDAVAACEGLVTWVPDKARDKIVKQLGKLPPGEWTEDAVSTILDTFESDQQERRNEHYEDIRSVARDLAIDGAVVENMINRLNNKPGFNARIK